MNHISFMGKAASQKKQIRELTMKRDHKNLLIWALFGVFWGKTVAMAIIDYRTVSTFDWVMMVVGGMAVIIHYLPDRKEGAEE